MTEMQRAYRETHAETTEDIRSNRMSREEAMERVIAELGLNLRNEFDPPVAFAMLAGLVDGISDYFDIWNEDENGN